MHHFGTAHNTRRLSPLIGFMVAAIMLAACQTGGGNGTGVTTENNSRPPAPQPRTAPRPPAGQEDHVAAKRILRQVHEPIKNEDYDRAEALLDQAETLMRPNVDTVTMRGEIAAGRGQHEKAVRLFRAAADIARQSNFLSGEATALGFASFSLTTLGRLAEAADTAERAADLLDRVNQSQFAGQLRQNARELRARLGTMPTPPPVSKPAAPLNRDRLATMQSLLTQAQIAHQRRDYRAMRKANEKIVQIAPDLPVGFLGLGNTALLEKDYDRAVEMYTRALQKARQMPHRYFEAAALDGISLSLFSKGDFSNGIEPGRQALKIYRDLGEAKLIGPLQKRIANAEQRLRRAGDTRTGIGHSDDKASTMPPSRSDRLKTAEHFGRGVALQHEGKLEAAEQHLRKAATGFERAQDPMQFLALAHIGRIRMARGDLRGAEKLFEKAANGLHEAGNYIELADTLVNVASIHMQYGDLPAALKTFRWITELGQEQAEDRILVAGLNGEGLVHRTMGDLQRASTIYARALQTARRVGNPVLITQIQAGQAGVLLDQGHKGEACRRFAKLMSKFQDLQQPKLASTLALDMGIAGCPIVN